MKQQKSENLTKKIYSLDPKVEWDRIVKDSFHKLEFNTTLHFLKKYFPKKGLVLDAGGGPGRYTIELAKLGYEIILLDITPKNIKFAKKQIKKAKVQNKIKNIIEGNIVNLAIFNDKTFDAVICLGGPLSHISEEKYRIRAISELSRVAKENAPIFISVMGKFGVLLEAPKGWPDEIEMDKHFSRLIHKGDDYKWHGKYYCHFFTLEELKELFSKNKNLRILKYVGLEGLATPSENEINELSKNKKAWKNWTKFHLEICNHPSIVDTSLHILIICKKLK